MSLSSFFIPSFDAGDDVLTFDLRLDYSYNARSTPCFCLEGHFCDNNAFAVYDENEEEMDKLSQREQLLRQITEQINKDSFKMDEKAEKKTHKITRFDPLKPKKCARTRNNDQYGANNIAVFGRSRRQTMDRIYNIILTPFTRWDAARFLSLVVDHMARIPDPEKGARIIKQEKKDETCSTQSTSSDQKHDDDSCPSEAIDAQNELFRRSEQNHAFFPLFPHIIRSTSFIIYYIIPLQFLPSTFEGIVVLTGLLLNIFFFIMTSIVLFELTYELMKFQSRTAKETTPMSTTSTDDQKIIDQAHLASKLFCLNPANVFFMTCYSESSFCFFTFLGHYYFMKANIIRYPPERANNDEKEDDGMSNTQLSFFQWLRLSKMALFCWILASATRSNGTFSSIFTLIILCAKVVQLWTDHLTSKESYNKDGRISMFWCQTLQMIIKMLFKVAYYSCYIFIITLPVIIHDLRGYDFHCNMDLNDESYYANMTKPEWCIVVLEDESTISDMNHNGDVNTRFSLYQHVQRKYWNVGFLRYYQWKQIPNFLLAAPILSLSVCGAFHWISNSWNNFDFVMHSNNKHVKQPGFRVRHYFSWAFFALNNSVKPDMKEESSDSCANQDLLGPALLPHYALLAGLFLLGATLTHVQISTRMICSSSPALYWYLAYLYSSNNGGKNFQRYLNYYLISFNLLGVIFHVNWLPWT